MTALKFRMDTLLHRSYTDALIYLNRIGSAHEIYAINRAYFSINYADIDYWSVGVDESYVYHSW